MLGTEDTRLQWEIYTQYDPRPVGTYFTHQAIEPASLRLTFYINQMSRKNIDTIYGEIELKISRFLSEAGGVFYNRNVSYESCGPNLVEYLVKISNVEVFQQLLETGHQKRIDAEFTQALEAKLAED